MDGCVIESFIEKIRTNFGETDQAGEDDTTKGLYA